MKTKELIQKLKALPQDAEVICSSDNFELNGSDVEVTHLWLYHTGKKTTKTFRDAFDGETYEKDIWSIVGGKNKVIVIG